MSFISLSQFHSFSTGARCLVISLTQFHSLSRGVRCLVISLIQFTLLVQVSDVLSFLIQLRSLNPNLSEQRLLQYPLINLFRCIFLIASLSSIIFILCPEISERLLEGQAFLRLYDSAPRPTTSPLSR
jgi:hypothetical protein